MLSHIHNESSAPISEKTTQTRMDARLARRMALHHTIHLPPAPHQIMIFNEQDQQSSVGAGEALSILRPYEPEYVMEPLVLKKDFVAAEASIEMGMPDEASAGGDSGGDEDWQGQEEDEDNAWLNDRAFPRKTSAENTPILKEQFEGTRDQQTLTCWF